MVKVDINFISTIIMLIIIQHYQPVICSHRQLGFAFTLRIYHGIDSSSNRGLKIVVKSKLKTFLCKFTNYLRFFILYFCDYVYIYVMILGFLFFIQTFLEHCKALCTEKYKRYRYINIFFYYYYYHYYYYWQQMP